MKFSDVLPIFERELGEQGRQFAQVLCRELSGECLYFPRNAVRPEVTRLDTPKTLQSRYGISRQCAYVWLRKYRQR